MNASCIVDVRAVAWDIALTEPFGIASGAQACANNVRIEVLLADGTVGLGEAAPFPAVSGETQALALQAIEDVRRVLLGEDARRWRHLAQRLRERIARVPSARAGLEAAVLDAFTRQARLPLSLFFGGAGAALRTDITIVTGDVPHARDAAARAAAQGFDTLKVKVGGVALEQDIARLLAIFAAAPAARVTLDANASLTAEQALALLAPLDRERVVLFEQPVAASDLTGMRQVREQGRIKVAADESARSASDVTALARHAAADVINIKIMKSGVAEACDMVAAARAAGLGLMIGGMVESPLAMVVSACLAAGHGGFEFVDLDTPLFMREIALQGWVQHGPHIELGQIGAGHGIDWSG